MLEPPRDRAETVFTERDKTMKFGKKLLAAVLAAVMALTMLTACSGSGQVNTDLNKSKEILTVVNQKRTDSAKSELTLSEDASRQLGVWAKAAAAQNANNTSKTQAAMETAREYAKSQVRSLTIDGKKIVKAWEGYSWAGVSVEDAQKAVAEHPEWFVHGSEDACNYVAIATYGSGAESATVVLMMLVK